MCGFFGVFGPSSSQLTSERQQKINKLLAHRGPDEFQVLENPNYRVMFWRLSIVDHSGGKQPMQSQDGRRTILFNGEVYNYKSLRQELESEGRVFRTQSDTEVILASYEKWGLSCFDRFEGMFAVALIDEAKDRVILARDRLGVKPLYFRQQAGGLSIASEQKALLSFSEQPPTIDRTGLCHYLVFQTVLGSRTMFEEISKVPPGLILEFSLSHQTLVNSRRMGPGVSWPEPKSYAEYRELARRIIEEQARLAFDSELSACFHLSGGIDSNILIALARRLFPSKNFLCLSSFVEGDQDPEAPLIREAARHHGLPLKSVAVTEENFFGALEEVIYHLDEPVGDPGVVAQFLVNQLAEGEAKLVYSGQGFDELFFGYMRDLASYVLADLGPNAFFSDDGPGGRLHFNTKQFFQGWEDFLRPLSQQSPQSAPLVLFKKLCRFDPFNGGRALGAGLMSSVRSVALEAFVKLQEGGSSFHDFMLQAETSIQLPSLLHMEDRASMRYSLETRVPFCTASILDVAKISQLPWKFHEGRPKGLLRDIFADILPPAIASRRQKVGRPIPFRSWLGSKRGQPYLKELESRKDLFVELLGADFVAYALEHPNPHDRSAWAALSLSRWIDLYRIKV